MLADSGYHTILPDQLYAYLNEGAKLPSKPIMLTFDDTVLDQFTVVNPTLKKYGYKAVVYIVTGEDHNRWDVEHPTHPDTPVIGFPKGSGAKLPAYARETGVDAVGLDETLDPAWAHASLPEGMPVQGNFDPLLLEAGGPAVAARVKTIIAAFEDRPHVFNLGHGIGQFTPISHVEELLAALRG